jgi:hypothetical protein
MKICPTNKDGVLFKKKSKLEQNFQNKLGIEDLKIEGGQLESQELPVYYSV